MRKLYLILAAAAFWAALSVPSAYAQATGTVKGVCKDLQGQPIDGDTVEYVSVDTGRKYELKCKKGQYFSLGITPGKYNVRLIKNGQELFHVNNFPVNLDENTLDFDLQKEQARVAQSQGMSAEELARRQAAQQKAAKENANIKALNEELASARTNIQAGNYDQAIATMNQATQTEPNRDLLWATLGDAYRASLPKQTDQAEKAKRAEMAAQAYQKAVQLKQADLQAGQKDPNGPKTIASYYNNLGDAQAKAGKTDDAIKAYDSAAQADPTGAATYYFNEGAIMTNTGKIDDAISAFDKAIAADPTKADAYYWKGVNLMGKAKLEGNKMVAPDGTAEAFNKYLELQPTGQFADPAKQMLASIGATVETSFGKQKKKTTKK
jgi:tetratricopeptide (TPR) repeat protein